MRHSESASSQGGDRTADAFRVLAKLETYEAHLRELQADWLDVNLWRRASRQIKELVAVAQDLLSTLTAQASPRLPGQKVAELDAAIEALLRKCLALI